MSISFQRPNNLYHCVKWHYFRRKKNKIWESKFDNALDTKKQKRINFKKIKFKLCKNVFWYRFHICALFNVKLEGNPWSIFGGPQNLLSTFCSRLAYLVGVSLATYLLNSPVYKYGKSHYTKCWFISLCFPLSFFEKNPY